MNKTNKNSAVANTCNEDIQFGVRISEAEADQTVCG